MWYREVTRRKERRGEGERGDEKSGSKVEKKRGEAWRGVERRAGTRIGRLRMKTSQRSYAEQDLSCAFNKLHILQLNSITTLDTISFFS